MKAIACVCLIVCSIVVGAQSAFAKLGEDESSIQSEALSFSGRHSRKARNRFTVHTITTDSSTIQEYVVDGKVVAVSWEGPKKPDLSSLLGDYFSDYKKAAKGRKQGQRHSSITTAKLHYRGGGHMRSLRGIAYALPLPQGFSIQDFQ